MAAVADRAERIQAARDAADAVTAPPIARERLFGGLALSDPRRYRARVG